MTRRRVNKFEVVAHSWYQIVRGSKVADSYDCEIGSQPVLLKFGLSQLKFSMGLKIRVGRFHADSDPRPWCLDSKRSITSQAG